MTVPWLNSPIVYWPVVWRKINQEFKFHDLFLPNNKKHESYIYIFIVNTYLHTSSFQISFNLMTALSVYSWSHLVHFVSTKSCTVSRVLVLVLYTCGMLVWTSGDINEWNLLWRRGQAAMNKLPFPHNMRRDVSYRTSWQMFPRSRILHAQ